MSRLRYNCLTHTPHKSFLLSLFLITARPYNSYLWLLFPFRFPTFVQDGMTANDLYFKWDYPSSSGDMKSAVSVGEELIMSQFAVDNFTVDEITTSYVTGVE